MNTGQRIALRITRLKGESIKTFCIFLVFAVLFLFVSAVSDSVSLSTFSFSEKYQPYIKQQPKEGREDAWVMTDSMAKKALEVENITGYNGIITIYSMMPDLTLIPGKFTQAEDPKFKLARMLGNSNSRQSEYFLSETLSLISGTHINDDAKNAALISADVAELNNIGIGDLITIETSADSIYGNPNIPVASFSLTVSGIFEVAPSTNEIAELKPECDMINNFVFIDLFTARQILSTVHERPYDGYNSGILFFSSQPTDLDVVSGQILLGLGISADDVALTLNDGGYSDAIAPLQSMNQMLTLVITIITIAGGAVIALTWYISIRKRIREFGILMSLGMSKIKIIAQVSIEALIFIVPAVLISASITSLIINVIDIKSVNLQLPPSSIVSLTIYMVMLLAIVIVIAAITIIRNKPRELFSHTN